MADRTLYRSTSDKRIAGVCGGLAAYFGMDSTLVRILYFIVLVVPGGVGILPYIILWIVLPKGETSAPASSSAITIAEERYARGEITSDELARIRQDLAR